MLKNTWDKALPQTSKQWKAVGICAIAWVAGISLLGSYSAEQTRKATDGAPQYSYQKEESPSEEVPSQINPAEAPTPPPPIPSVYLPLNTGYLPEKEIKDKNGYSELTLKNNSDSNFHVKLYYWYSGKWLLSREAYLKAQEEFTMKDLSPGEYEVRRMDVQTKNATKSETFTLEEIEKQNRVEYSTMVLTFNAYRGNSRIIPISAKEF